MGEAAVATPAPEGNVLVDTTTVVGGHKGNILGTPGDNPETPAAPAAAPKESPTRAFAAAARREKALQRQREEIAAAKAALEAEKAEIARQKQEWESKYGQKPKSAREALARDGFTYDDATNEVLNDNQPTAEQVAKAALQSVEEFKAEQAAKDAQQAKDNLERAERAAAEQIENFHAEIAQECASRPADYELITLHDALPVVYNVIEQNFEATRIQDAKKRGVPIEQGIGKVLEPKEALDLVESLLKERVEKALSTRHFKAKTPDPKEPAAKPAQTTPQQQPRRTISNDMTPTMPTIARSGSIEDEAFARAMAKL